MTKTTHNHTVSNLYKSLLLLMLAGGFAFTASAQNMRRSMAAKYFADMDYYRAAPAYDELAYATLKKGLKGKAVDWESVRKAAQANAYTRNYKKSAWWYGELVKGQAADPTDWMDYFEALRYLGDYSAANAYIDSLKRVTPNNELVKEYANNRAYYNRLRKDSARYKIKELTLNKGLGDFGPAYYGEGLVFASSRRNSSPINNRYGRDNTYFLNLFYAKKEGDDFSRAAKMQKRVLRTNPHDGPIHFSTDGKRAFITRNRTEKDVRKGDIVGLSLYVANKGENGKWGVPQPFQHNSAAYSTGHASLSADGNTLYFASDMPGGQGGVDIWKCQKQGAGWSKPVNLGKTVNTGGDEMFPFVAKEGTLFFASKGHAGLGGFDVFEARRAGNGYMPPINMGYPVNTQYDDFALITDADIKTGYFSSDRSDYVDRIYGVSMDRIALTLELQVLLTGTKHDSIPGAAIIFINKITGDTVKTVADSTGRSYITLDRETDYHIMANDSGYTLKEGVSFSTKGITQNQTIKEEVFLVPGKKTVKPTGKTVRPTVRLLDCAGKLPIANAQVIIKDLATGKESSAKTDSNGEVTLGNITDVYDTSVVRSKYTVEAVEQGYLPKTEKLYFEAKGNAPESMLKEMCIERIQKGNTFALEDIYYEYNKATLQPISKIRLDKVYDFLQNNPGVKIQLSSFTDSRGSDSYNLALSQRRAQSCVDYLCNEKGIPASRIVAKGYGESKLVNKCSNGVPCTDEEHQANRRTEVHILETQ